MQLSNLKVLGICLGIGLLLGAGGGAVYAVVAGKVVLWGIGTGLLLTGLVALALGLLGATEPPGGWSLKRTRNETPRRSFAARAAYEHRAINDQVSSASLAVWGVVVGGSLIGLAVVVFELGR